MDSTALAPISHEAIGLVRQPEEVLNDAQRAATALMAIVANKKHKLVFNDEQYLEVDDWQTIGAFHGCTADIEWTRPITIGDAQGWEARAVLVDRNGRILSHAESMCLDDEDKWSARPKYEWVYMLKSGGTSVDDPGPDEIIWEDNPNKPGRKRPKKERVLTGEVSVPQFQIRSMAQTRALAKVHSNVFRWVVQLAGFRGTPAEELPVSLEPQDGDYQNAKPVTAAAKPAAAKPAPAKPATPAKPVIDVNAATTIAGIEPLSYISKKKDGTQETKPMWAVTFSDGRSAMAFSKEVADLAIEIGPDVPVVPTLEESAKQKGKFKLNELVRA